MSSAQPHVDFSGPNTDSTMIDVPDSPPETSHLPLANQSVPAAASISQHSAPNHLNNESTKVNHGAPGSTWNTKKFNEEYERAYGSLLDQNWDQTKYGDPLIQG